MVNTRSQIERENRNEQSEVDRLADDDDDISVADHYSGRFFNENHEETMRSLEKETMEDPEQNRGSYK